MATTRPRYTVSVDNEMFERIEDYRFKNRFNTRSEATVQLIKVGLENLESNKSLDKVSYQILNKLNKLPQDKKDATNYLINILNNLNTTGVKQLLDFAANIEITYGNLDEGQRIAK